MAKLSQEDKDFLKLLQRSPDLGDGWRSCSVILWERVVLTFPHQELLELDCSASPKRIRLSETGRIVFSYLT